jgi:hypothetical protein
MLITTQKLQVLWQYVQPLQPVTTITATNTKYHPQACYTSHLFDFTSKKLNEILENEDLQASEKVNNILVSDDMNDCMIKDLK